MRNFTKLLAGVVVATFAAAAGADDPKKDDAKAGKSVLDGGYTLVSGESDGKPIPEEKIKGSTTRFTGDKIVSTDKDSKETYVATFTLDDSKTPWVISMKATKPQAGEAKGLIKKDGDTITLIYALPGGEMPTEFKTKEKQNMFVLKNMKK